MYCVGADIQDDRDFYGREELIPALLETPERMLFLMGFRRTGKTAVLLALQRAALRGDALLPVMLVLQGQRDLDDVRDDLATALRRLQRAVPGLELPGLLQLRRYALDTLLQLAADAAAEAGRGLLLLLDEADTLLRLAETDPRAVARLRAALPRGTGDRVVMAGARSALTLAEPGSLPGETEPFLSGFGRRLLDPVLDEQSARSLIALDKRGGEGAVRLDTAGADALLRRTGGQPFLLQAACDHLRTHGGDVARAVASVVALRASTEAFYADLQRLSPSERDVLSALLRGERTPADLDVYRRSLVELGVLNSNGDFRVPALADYLKQTGWRAIPSRITDASAAPGVHAPPTSPDAPALHGGAFRYRLLRQLGGGGFGEVWLVRLMDAGGFERLAALKLLLGQWADHDEVAARIREEGRLLGRLRHRSIVRVEFPVEVDGRFGFIMEYVPGLDLFDLIGARAQIGPVPAQVAADVLAEVATALDVALNRVPDEASEPLGVLHRDIKPANIRVTRDGEVKVLDFGIARSVLDRPRGEADGMGTPAYFAPERHRGDHRDPASDTYALGLVVAELGLDSTPRFPPGDRHVHDAAVAITLAKLPADWGALRPLLQRMLAFDPRSRPPPAEITAAARALSLPGPGLLAWAADVVPWLVEERTSPPIPTAVPEAAATVAFEGELTTIRG